MDIRRLIIVGFSFLSIAIQGEIAAESPPSDDVTRLDRGEILADGGYRDKEVWGAMRGVIDAPPELVWTLFFEADHWKAFLPNVTDGRIVTDKIVEQVSPTSNVRDFYRLLGGQVFPSSLFRAKGGRWTGYVFHYYDIPWPVANRWVIVRNDHDESRRGEGFFGVRWTRAAGNMRTFEGSMTLSPFQNNRQRTEMSHNIKSDPSVHVPRFLLKWGVKKVMPAMIHAIRHEAAKQLTGHRNIPLLKIQER